MPINRPYLKTLAALALPNTQFGGRVKRRSFLATIGLTSLLPFTRATAPAEAASIGTYTLPHYTGWRAHSVFRLLPSRTKRMAWTVDDGFNPEAVHRYIQFIKRRNIRLTFFVVAAAPAWTKYQAELQPLIDSGQVQIANHTARHRDLTKLSASAIRAELVDNHQFIQSTFGIDARPFFRPPFGAINMRVVREAAAVGYTKPIIWSGTLADASKLSTRRIAGFARRYVFNGVVLLGHANNLRTAPIFDYILGLARRKGLKTVTLNDVYTPRPQGPANVTATPGADSVHVEWLPVKNAQTYTVTANPGSASMTVHSPATEVTFTTLTNGTPYTFTVVARALGVNSYTSAASAPAAPIGG